MKAQPNPTNVPQQQPYQKSYKWDKSETDGVICPPIKREKNRGIEGVEIREICKGVTFFTEEEGTKIKLCPEIRIRKYDGRERHI